MPSLACSRWTRVRFPRRSGERDRTWSRSETSFVTNSTATESSSSSPSAGEAPSTNLPEWTTLVVNADDPLLAEVGGERERVLTFGVDDPRHAREACSMLPTRSIAFAAGIRTPTQRRMSDTSATIAAQRAVTSGRRSTSRPERSSSKGWRDPASGSTRPTAAPASSCRFQGSTTSTTPLQPLQSRLLSTPRRRR